MKKTTTANEVKPSARLIKLENKVHRAEIKLANTEAKLIKRKAKLAAAREAYETVLAACAEHPDGASADDTARNGDGQTNADADD
jgi:hypothetical protein